jgi:hypothetical protein
VPKLITLSWNLEFYLIDKYDKRVETYEINPPISGGLISWGAKAHVKKIGTGRVDDVIQLSEHWGKTGQEAAAKADTEAIAWIEKHS